jgi:hypothetical protein
MLCWLYPKTFWGLSSGRVSIRYNWVYHVDILVTLSTFWLSVKWSADIEALHRYSFTWSTLCFRTNPALNPQHVRTERRSETGLPDWANRRLGIGWFFFTFWQVFDNYRSSQKFSAKFSPKKWRNNFDGKNGLATFWAIFSQTHLVTLIRHNGEICGSNVAKNYTHRKKVLPPSEFWCWLSNGWTVQMVDKSYPIRNFALVIKRKMARKCFFPEKIEMASEFEKTKKQKILKWH